MMRAVILASRLGSRLRLVVPDRPKAMAEIAGKPFLEYQIQLLRRFDVRHIVLCVGYRYKQIQSHFGNGAPWGINIEYVVERETSRNRRRSQECRQVLERDVLGPKRRYLSRD